MSDHHTAGPLRHHADKHVTVPTKPGSQIGILGDCFVCKMSTGQHTPRRRHKRPPHRKPRQLRGMTHKHSPRPCHNAHHPTPHKRPRQRNTIAQSAGHPGANSPPNTPMQRTSAHSAHTAERDHHPVPRDPHGDLPSSQSHGPSDRSPDRNEQHQPALRHHPAHPPPHTRDPTRFTARMWRSAPAPTRRSCGPRRRRTRSPSPCATG